ncbi:MAG: lactate dehydrogenase [Candidatus Atribacteria bacterium]
MFFYKLKNKILISESKKKELQEITEDKAKKSKYLIYALTQINPLKSRRSFSISDSSLMFLKEEGIHLLQKPKKIDYDLPIWLKERIEEKRITSLNTEYPNWQDMLTYEFPSRWKINIIGLGDVGGALLAGLRLLGEKCIKSIGIYDKNRNAIKRWELEANQIFNPFTTQVYPEVHVLDEEEIFNCDLFVFCATVGVPLLGEEQEDVRMKQFEGNSKIISDYAQKAREKSFKGIFAVISDPVDLLCKSAFLASNKNKRGKFDFKGLAPEQIRGYGLGVMHARAIYYSKQFSETIKYSREGRAFGPHGRGLIIANSIEKYDKRLSEALTNKTLKANLEIRKTGFKPYVAPALSSACFPIIATISEKWHYSATFMGGVFMGAKNRLHKSGTEIERLDIPAVLVKKIKASYKELGNIL